MQEAARHWRANNQASADGKKDRNLQIEAHMMNMTGQSSMQMKCTARKRGNTTEGIQQKTKQ